VAVDHYYQEQVS